MRWSCTHPQSVCFESTAHNQLCTTLYSALASVVLRSRSALNHFPCPLDHSGTAWWPLRVKSCVLELHTPSKCVFRVPSHNRLCTTLNIALGSVVPRGRSALKHFPCPLDHSGTAWWLLRVNRVWWSCTHPQSVCFEPKAHNRLCTTLNIALGSVVPRGRSLIKNSNDNDERKGAKGGVG